MDLKASETPAFILLKGIYNFSKANIPSFNELIKIWANSIYLKIPSYRASHPEMVSLPIGTAYKTVRALTSGEMDINISAWGNSSIGKGLPTQAQGPKSDSQYPLEKAGHGGTRLSSQYWEVGKGRYIGLASQQTWLNRWAPGQWQNLKITRCTVPQAPTPTLTNTHEHPWATHTTISAFCFLQCQEMLYHLAPAQPSILLSIWTTNFLHLPAWICKAGSC